jgi:hypothetical protein
MDFGSLLPIWNSQPMKTCFCSKSLGMSCIPAANVALAERIIKSVGRAVKTICSGGEDGFFNFAALGENAVDLFL